MDSIDSANGHISFTNYVAFQDLQTGRSRVGHYHLAKKSIQPLAFSSGTPLDNLYQVIEVGESNIIPAGPTLPISSVKILPPFTGRDILCVGKNYAEHAKEFNSSGFDSSDKVDTPSHPVIFTKRFTSIVADGDDIFPHPDFTSTIDYEGEIGVIIGKAGFRISEEDAMSHVWGYTIVNDVTARERQRDHKQFYIGKSPDTFCPMVCKYSSPNGLALMPDNRDQSLCRCPKWTRFCGFRHMSTVSYDKTQQRTTSYFQFHF